MVCFKLLTAVYRQNVLLSTIVNVVKAEMTLVTSLHGLIFQCAVIISAMPQRCRVSYLCHYRIIDKEHNSL